MSEGPVAVVGAGGFIGAHVIRRLAGQGRETIAIRRGDVPPARELAAVVDCNGDSRRFWANENPAEAFRVNVLSVVDRLTTLRYGRYVFVSTVDVYGPGRAAPETSREESVLDGRGLDTYGLHKLMAERLVRHHAPDALILRLGTVIGPGLRKNPIHDALNGHPIRQTLDSTLSLIGAGNVADAVALLLEGGEGGVFNVTSSAPITVGRVLELVAAHLGKGTGDFEMHRELLRTDYRPDPGRLAGLTELPTSEQVLLAYLAGPL